MHANSSCHVAAAKRTTHIPAMHTKDDTLDAEQLKVKLLTHIRGLVLKAKAHVQRSSQTYKRYHDRAAKALRMSAPATKSTSSACRAMRSRQKSA